MTNTTTGTAVVTLPTDTRILITREFDAPRHLVYRAWTEPALIRRWWNSGHGEVTVADVDLRVGGTWRYVLVTPSGHEVGFHGVYREIVPNERLVNTEAYEGIPDADEQASVNTHTFTEVDGRTTLTLLVEHRTPEGRTAHVDSGMESGMQKGLDLLEEIAVSLR
ncbi:SRPBCC family protein [Umezawaea sp. Da 62-37]|uniref:SRPBCC family protein n=1 Tax=Umezawaea sp. Da 62-37 TaxID=3075927 RepID=UPI0028F6C662|nr:SRPBCC family protein [Umezawaea sp. Da 62-37]WNV88769.1 SRPBCC family protein [Umezawaea sp. Da 62-37]